MELNNILFNSLLKELDKICTNCYIYGINQDNGSYKIYHDLQLKIKNCETCEEFLDTNPNIKSVLEDILNNLQNSNRDKKEIQKERKLSMATSFISEYITKNCDYDFYGISTNDNVIISNDKNGKDYILDNSVSSDGYKTRRWFENNEDFDYEKYKDLMQAGFISLYYVTQIIYYK